MLKNPKVSIVVPVYNVESYLPRCVDSIVNQIFDDFEVILVDDGSTDNSGKICDEYALKDNRIKVLHQKNSGTIKARNVGLNIAKGKYIGFVDADDYIEPEMYEILYNTIESRQYDIVWCNVVIEMKDKSVVSVLDYSEDPKDLLHQLLRGNFPGWLCKMLISFDFYKSCNVCLDSNCSVLEDVLITTQLLYNYPKLKHVNSPLYIYNRLNDCSLTQKSVYKKGLLNIVKIESFLRSKGIFDTYYNSFCVLAMRLKLELCFSDSLSKAKKVFPYAHKNKINFPLNDRFKCLYYIFFNWGFIGYIMFYFYSVIKKIIVYLK